ncbi:MAG: galactokinase [Candidatus Cyclobacteriaceae bacterium M2_1C_046]
MEDQSYANRIRKEFEKQFDKIPMLFRSPGRINLIGEHTDYNDGFVLPAAIDKEIIMAITKNDSARYRLFSLEYNKLLEIDLDLLSPVQDKDDLWANYILGVVDQLKAAGYNINGFDCVFGGNIPIGAGMSSSAALECCTAYALSELFDLNISKTNIALFAQKAEHNYAGVQCGIMDQYASVMGKKNHAIRLDCRSLDFGYFPLEFKEYQIILCDTNVKHSLANSKYNTRRKECEEGVAMLKQKFTEISSLRDATFDMVEQVKGDMTPEVYKRCRYIVEENDRVVAGSEFLKQGDIEAFGEKMYKSHQGLSVLYEVSCPELDFLVDLTLHNDNIVGARMMGGGFGGCTINIIKRNEKEVFINEAKASYKAKFNRELTTYEVEIMDGTSKINLQL